jgi:hypothetical protein
MTDRLRRAGAGSLHDGTTVVWSVAEGAKGRRWREVRSGPDGVISSLLLETDVARRFSHLELSTAVGLLTLHPEPDGTLHGNIVRAAGIHHVVGRRWAAGAALSVEGSPTAAAAAAWQIAGSGGPLTGNGLASSVTVSLELELREWRGGGSAKGTLATFDDDGLPRLAGGDSWPLDLDPSLS